MSPKKSLYHQHADKDTDKLYKFLRSKHGEVDSQANGYRFEAYFKREQEIILSQIDPDAEIIVDVACGSGLMIAPLITEDKLIVGVDFNEQAVCSAKGNHLEVIRGDAFLLPFANTSIDQIINCQFLNQQRAENTRQLISEAARVLKPGGRLIMIWRNHTAWIHQLALIVYRVIDQFTGRPEFPYYDNPLDIVRSYCHDAGFSATLQYELVFPLAGWHFKKTSSIWAKVFGASCFLVIEK